MPKEKLENLTVEQLKKRKRLMVSVLTIVTLAAVIDAAVFLYLIFIGDLSDLSFLIPGIVCIFFALFFFNGLKKLNTELNKRDVA